MAEGLKEITLDEFNCLSKEGKMEQVSKPIIIELDPDYPLIKYLEEVIMLRFPNANAYMAGEALCRNFGYVAGEFAYYPVTLCRVADGNNEH